MPFPADSPPNLGFRRMSDAPVGVSDAEAMAVSTDPNSPVQQAISGRSFLKEGFIPTSELIQFGPKFVQEDTESLIRREKLKQQMASDAINLASGALTLRERQSRANTAQAQQAQLNEFNQRTQGMTAAQKWENATPEDLQVPSIIAQLEAETNARKNVYSLEDLKRKEGLAKETEADMRTVAIEGAKAAAINARVASREAQKALEGEYDPIAFSGAMAETRLGTDEESDKIMIGLMDRLADTGEAGLKAREATTKLMKVQEQFSEVMSAYPGEFSEEAGSSIVDAYRDIVENGTLSSASMLAMGRELANAKKVQSQMNARIEMEKTIVERAKNFLALSKELSKDSLPEALDSIVEMKTTLLKLENAKLTALSKSRGDKEALNAQMEVVNDAADALKTAMENKEAAITSQKSNPVLERAQSEVSKLMKMLPYGTEAYENEQGAKAPVTPPPVVPVTPPKTEAQKAVLDANMNIGPTGTAADLLD